MNVYFLIILAFVTTIINAYNQEIDPKLTEVWQPVPEKVNSTVNQTPPPSDAIVLFNGENLNEWTNESDGKPNWDISEGILTVKLDEGMLISKRKFGDCQLHIEWKSPIDDDGEGQGKGNSGVFFMSQYEIQILDSYSNVTYSNGQAGSVYKQYIPLVNASNKSGVWQSYDIIFTAPVFRKDSTLISPAYFTVLHNNVLIQNHVELKGKTVYKGDPHYVYHEKKLPITLQNHGDLVSFRNIWIREL